MIEQRMEDPDCERGSILLMVLVLTGMVTVFLLAGVLFAGRQYTATVDQEQEERAFHAAEAGLHYTLYLLNSQLSGEDEFSLLEAGVWPEQTVYQEDTGDVLGTYNLTFEVLPSQALGGGLVVWSLGHDAAGRRCQLIRAEIRRVSTQVAAYRLAAWDQQSGCDVQASSSPLLPEMP